MDRPIVYPSEQGRSTDFLFGQRAAMIGMSKLAEAMFGTGTFTTGLSVGPNSPAALNVIVQPGQVFMTAPVDAAAYGSLAADTAHSILKQGLLMDAATIACPAPTSAGYSINYLIEATYQDQDTNNLVLPYFNSANPSQPLSGQNNSGAPQATERQGVCVVQAKAGAAAVTGTQTTPALDSGYVGLAVVTVAYGQSTIAIGNISGYISPVIPSGGAINNSLSAILNKNVAGSSNVTLDQLGEAVYPIINLTGALTGNISVIVPAASRKWVFANNTTGAFSVTVITPAGTGIVVPQGTAMVLYCDGVNVLNAMSDTMTQTAADTRYGSSSLSIGASVAANALTVTLNPCKLDFRNATLTSGAPVNASIAAALNLTVPSGATLGMVASNPARLIVLVAYNAGNQVLCIANIAGGLRLDETNLISPTTISAAATANNVIYSAAAVAANSPYRVVGFIDISEATPGTWATAPTTVQGTGGQAFAAMSSIGYGQSYNAVTRTSGVTYYNTTGKPIFGFRTAYAASNTVFPTTTLSLNGGPAFVIASGTTGSNAAANAYYIIPAGVSFVFTDTNSSSEAGSELS